MEQIKQFDRKIRSSGDSLTIVVTREVKDLGLDKDDLVRVTLEKPSEKSSLGPNTTLSPLPSFENTHFLVAGDLYLNGSRVEDYTSTINQFDRLVYSSYLEAWEDSSRKIKQCTRSLVSCDFASYSAVQGSFVALFKTIKSFDSVTSDLFKLKATLEMVNSLTDDPLLSSSALDSVSSLREYVKDVVIQIGNACAVFEDYYSTENTPTSNLEDTLSSITESLNRQWNSKHAACQNKWYVGMVIFHSLYNGYPDCDGYVAYRLVSGPSKKYVRDTLESEFEEESKAAMLELEAFEFDNKEDAHDFFSMLGMKSRTVNNMVESGYVKECKDLYDSFQEYIWERNETEDCNKERPWSFLFLKNPFIIQFRGPSPPISKSSRTYTFD